MSLKNSIKNIFTRYLLVFLILGQLSNAFLVTNLLESKNKIAFSSDADNNSKEDKNNLDGEEESKILESLFHPIDFPNKSNHCSHFIQNFTDVSNTEDFPPPEQFLLI